jgi:hypothetical protein
MNIEYKTQNGNWVESMSECRARIKISVSIRRWTRSRKWVQNFSRVQEGEGAQMSRECGDEEDGGSQVFCSDGLKSWACCVNCDPKSLNKGTYL